MNIFRGKLCTEEMIPFPEVLNDEQRNDTSSLSDIFQKFVSSEVNSVKYDEAEEFDSAVLNALADQGAYGLQAPEEFLGAGLNNTSYARLVSVVGSYDLALGTHLGAHQSIGYKGIVLYGNAEQKLKYIPDLASGKKTASYCLTEPQSGSDASSIQTTAVLSTDGKHYTLNGTKIWITNGGIADVFTVFARTTVKNSDGTTKDNITAFIVERSFGGLTHSAPEKKMGIKASNTVTIYLEDCKVPVENVLGQVGDGFKIAVNILNQGRFGMASALSGTMRKALSQAVDHATQRKQFGRLLIEFENVKEKLSTMAFRQYTTESMAFMISGTMDLGAKDFQVEAAISKIYSSESAWYCVDEAIQILGGTGFMRSANLERFLRDLRVFRIFEGANDVLRLFVALTGLNYAGKHLRAASKSPIGLLNLIVNKAGRTLGIRGEGKNLKSQLPPALLQPAELTGLAIDQFGATCTDLLARYGKGIMDEQFRLIRLADCAIEIYGMTCALSRAAMAIEKLSDSAEYETQLATLACNEYFKSITNRLPELNSPKDYRPFVLKRSAAELTSKSGGIACPSPLGF